MTLAKYVGTAHIYIGFCCIDVWNILDIQYIQVVYLEKRQKLQYFVFFLNFRSIFLKISFIKRRDRELDQGVFSSN